MIEVSHLSKKYADSPTSSLEDVSFRIDDGELVQLAGLNGAGKSTLLKLLCKILRPTAGTILINGKDIWAGSNTLHDTGFLLQPAFDPSLSAYDNLKLYRDINQLSAADSEISELLELVGLREDRRQKSKNFSFGMKQRLGLAQALLGNPGTLILDEPFVGLDPQSTGELLTLLKRKAAARNMQVIISGRQLFDPDSFCDRKLILFKGRLVFDGIPKKEPELFISLDADYRGDLSLPSRCHIQGSMISAAVSDVKFDLLMREIMSKYKILEVFQQDSPLEKYFKEN